MIARAPGKLVLSGAYAVLEGAPAVVTAVDRYAVSDARREAVRVTPEVWEALRRRNIRSAPWFDASALRDEKNARKLGLGSSAAILVASLASIELSNNPHIDDATLAARILRPALEAHRSAQGGGSGVDVAASVHGGVLRFQCAQEPDGLPRVADHILPAGLGIEVWSSPREVSTSEMLLGVSRFRAAYPCEYDTIMGRLWAASVHATEASDSRSFVAACREQLACLKDLGDAARTSIVTPEVCAFDRAVRERTDAVVLPSGAGGGDVVLVIGAAPLHEATGAPFGFRPLPLRIGARGVHAKPAVLQEPREIEMRP